MPITYAGHRMRKPTPIMKGRSLIGWLVFGLATTLALVGEWTPARSAATLTIPPPPGVHPLTVTPLRLAWRSEKSDDRPLWRSVTPSPREQAACAGVRGGTFFELDDAALRRRLAGVPPENACAARNSTHVLEVPTPDGKFARFRLVESPVMEPELAVRFPDIKTYAGQGLDDPTQTMRCDLTPQGFHAIVLGGTDVAFTVLPVTPGRALYAVASPRTADFARGFPCEALPAVAGTKPSGPVERKPYRLETSFGATASPSPPRRSLPTRPIWAVVRWSAGWPP